MPILESTYQPIHSIFKSSHVNTIYASLIRRWLSKTQFTRERLELNDGDFLDLDWAKVGSKNLIILLSGLEGKSSSLYSRAALKHFNNKEWDVLCMNYRGCSGEPNRLLNGYHMGASGDIKETVQHIVKNKEYQNIAFVGYSLGGNLALKYIGEEGDQLPKEIIASVNFSVPLSIKKSNERLNEWYNWHYKKWFMLPLNYKARKKKRQFPEKLKNYRGFFMSGDFLYFDKHYTAPANGFKTVEEYWEKSSSHPFLETISVPSLIISSKDDSFISSDCYPLEAARKNSNLFLEIPQHGGHCGFIRKLNESVWWMEERALEFIEQQIHLPSPTNEGRKQKLLSIKEY